MEAIVGDLLKPKTEAIVNASNGVGIMGAGVAGAITSQGGSVIRQEAQQACKDNGKPFEPGEAFVTGSGRLTRRGIKRIYHAVTMKFPGGFTSIDIVSKAMQKVLELAIAEDIKSIAIPGLGTGIGRLDHSLVADTMVTVAQEFDSCIEIKILDFNQSFIDGVNKAIGK